MNKSPLLVAVTAALSLAVGALIAAETDKPITVSGEAKCAKCALNETPSCQGAVQVMNDGKLTTYYLAQNEVSKSFHSQICQATVNATVTGTVKEENGKMILTAAKIEPKK